MHYIQSWNETIVTSFQHLWQRVISFIPELAGALLVFIVGLVIASLLAKGIKALIRAAHLDKLVNQTNIIKRLRENGLTLQLSDLVAGIVRWFFIIITLITAVDILRLPEVNNFLESIVLYLPNVIVAIIILGIGLVLGEFIARFIKKSTRISTLNPSIGNVLGTFAEWAIIIFSTMASLVQLGVATNLIQILFSGLVASLTLAFGLAFGLGGKEKAAKFLDEFILKK